MGESTKSRATRRSLIGAEPEADGTAFRIWAPGKQRVAIVIDDVDHDLQAEPTGYFSGLVSGARPGTEYLVRLDGVADLLPDPASRCQPSGPFGPSRVLDPGAFAWTDDGWHGAKMEGQIAYEMHVGTFTPEGTWAAAAEKLSFLKEVGITLVEMMPVNDFAGRFGWGYDGVGLFAPTRLYGKPDDLRHFIDQAHALGIAVILDVVYNHLGPDGNVLPQFSEQYFTDKYKTDWGAALNFDAPGRQGMRDVVLANTAYWISEFHFDGLRLDATQCIFDTSEDHIIAALADAARKAAGERKVVVIAENEPQATELVRSRQDGGLGLDGVWNDDFHHAARVAVTGRNEAYYRDFAGTAQELVSAAKYGYLFQGQVSGCKGRSRGTPGLALAPWAFVNFVQNHDQIANSASGLRLHQLTSPGRARAITALTLLMPGTPMLFQGQEFWASAPFLYFADHRPDIAEMVRKGRKGSLAIFASLASEDAQAALADPENAATFEMCKLDWTEAQSNMHAVALHRDLIALRADLKTPLRERGGVDGSILTAEALLLRYFSEGGDDHLLFVNLGADLHLRTIADPLVAPPTDRAWALRWSSEDPRYAGGGTPSFHDEAGWHVAGHSAMLLSARPLTSSDVAADLARVSR